MLLNCNQSKKDEEIAWQMSFCFNVNKANCIKKTHILYLENLTYQYAWFSFKLILMKKPHKHQQKYPKTWTTKKNPPQNNSGTAGTVGT